jgi:hypothetical protein
MLVRGQKTTDRHAGAKRAGQVQQLGPVCSQQCGRASNLQRYFSQAHDGVRYGLQLKCADLMEEERH